MRVFLCAMLVALAGCGGKRTERDDAPAPQTKGKETPKKDSPASELPQTLNQRHQGRTAEAWGQELLDSDEATSHAAAFALNKMGGESLRFTSQGLKSRHPHVRKNSMFIAMAPEAIQYPDEFLPALRSLLKDESPEIRGLTALTLARWKFPDQEGTLTIIREARATESVGDTKRLMDEAIKMLTKK